MDTIPITKEGYDKLKQELENLKGVSIPANIRDIEVARAHGDLSENAEYTAAKERQAFLHARLQELESQISRSQIIEITETNGNRAVFGLSVAMVDLESDESLVYQLVGPLESDISAKKISVTSPIGKALIGRSIGDTVRVKTPGGMRNLEITDIFNAKKEKTGRC